MKTRFLKLDLGEEDYFFNVSQLFTSRDYSMLSPKGLAMSGRYVSNRVEEDGLVIKLN
jgi:hypothetical protein